MSPLLFILKQQTRNTQWLITSKLLTKAFPKIYTNTATFSKKISFISAEGKKAYTLLHHQASAFLEAVTLSPSNPLYSATSQLGTSYIPIALPLCTMHRTYLTPNYHLSKMKRYSKSLTDEHRENKVIFLQPL